MDSPSDECFNSMDMSQYDSEMQTEEALNDEEELEEVKYSPLSSDLYYTLLNMFPNVDANYIKEICIDPPFQNIDGDLQSMLINHLLGYNDDVVLGDTANDEALSEMLQLQDIEREERQKQDEELKNQLLFTEFLQKDQQVIDDKMKILVNILPDACPRTLRKYVEENHENADSLEQLVENFLDTKNYQKRDQYYEQIKNEKKLREYISAFNVDKFVRMFPDPFDYFEDPRRKGVQLESALQFLQKRFSVINSQTLANAYSKCEYNLSLADKYIQETYQAEPQIQLEIDVNNEPLLQEIAFIQNRTIIATYLEKLRQEEEKEIQILRKQKLLFECQCCFDEFKPIVVVECKNNHIFCQKCIVKGTEIAITNSETCVKCFQGCEEEIDLNILRQVLPTVTFNTFLNKRQEAEVKSANIDGLEDCPFCGFSMDLAPQIQIFTCKNPECMKITCRMCKKLNHLPIKCNDVLDEDKARKLVEEEMSKTLIRYCWKCQKPFIKSYGCNKMQCSHCGALMCYICKKQINGYDHFDKVGMCKTNQNSDVFDTEQLQMKRLEITSKIHKDFPDLKIPEV